MTHNITEISNFDNKRIKVKLDEGELAFLLYKGEGKHLKTGPLSDVEYQAIIDDILIPRAKKRVLYFLKNADKTRTQIRRKLEEGYYPDEVIDRVMEFLDHYGFADDGHYAESYVSELKGNRSKREIEVKLKQKGISSEVIKEQISDLSAEDEYAAAEKALRKKYPAGCTKEDRQKAYAFLMRKGFGYDSIEHAFNSMKLLMEDD